MKRIIFFTFLCLIVWPAAAQKKSKKQTNPPPPAVEKPKPANGLKPYTDVITKDAVTSAGLITTHKVNSKYYFEIPDSLLNREMLWVSKISGFVNNLSFGGAGMGKSYHQDYVVRFEKRETKIYLRAVSYNSIADPELPIYESVRYNNFDPVIYTFDIQTMRQDSSHVIIDVTDFFVSDIDLMNPFTGNMKTQFGIRNHDKSRSMIDRIKSFDQNVEIKHTLTYVGTQLPDNDITGTLSVQMNQSIVLLPKKPMMVRYYDPRVGYNTVSVSDYGIDEQRTAKRSFITRWRLEPKDWNAWKRGELVEPIKPIVYYIDPATPEKYRRYLKQGVEDWQVAFEAIGFKNAIMAKDPPSKEEDPDWSAEDIRYSVIRYITTDIINAQGPSVIDPRSGEIIEADILWYHNVMTWLRTLYTVQTGAYNASARVPRLSDEEMGRLIRYVCAHEVGHTLGLPHNMAASNAYPVDSLRSPSFTNTWGITPSIMEYARANYVAQPGDGNVYLLNDKIGPYDMHAIKWGYQPIPEATTPDAETQTLQQWIQEKAGNKVYRFGRQTFVNHIDPTAQMEDLGDDPVKAGQYGVANLKRILPNLVQWSAEPGKDFTTLQDLYGQVLSSWGQYMGHAAHVVGGLYENPTTAELNLPVHTRLSKQQQRAAVLFLNEHCFTTPTYLLRDDILRRLEPAGSVERMRQMQMNSINILFDFGRIARLLEAEAEQGNKAYTFNDLLTDTRNGIWRRVESGTAQDIYQRNLQRGFIDKLEALMTKDQPFVPVQARKVLGYVPVSATLSDIRPQVRAELKQLNAILKRARTVTSDKPTQLHYDDLIVRIDTILDPNG